MAIAIVHGYFLGDSGSAIYVRELAREFTRQGHDVTLVCQDSRPEDHGFIDSYYELDEDNRRIITRFERSASGPGSCRLVRPALDGRLLTYVPGPFPGYDAVTFQQAAESRIKDYIRRNTRALTAVFSRWRPDFVQANHMVMQPYTVREALEGRAPYIVTIHGSALNFTVKADARMVPYAIDGLSGATAIGALSESSREDVVSFCAGHGLDVSAQTVLVPPGVDTKIMRPLSNSERRRSRSEISSSIGDEDAVAVSAGRLLWTKGVHYLVAALPLALESRPDMHLVLAGEGPMERSLKALVALLDAGELDRTRELVGNDDELRPGDDYGPVIPELDDDAASRYVGAARGNIAGRVHFAGHLPHERLAAIYGAADISLTSSVFPEAFALVSIEALAAGAVPLVTYQTGLMAAADAVAAELDDPSFRSLVPGVTLTEALARSIVRVLDEYPTSQPAFRARLHRLAENAFSWARVANRYVRLANGGA